MFDCIRRWTTLSIELLSLVHLRSKTQGATVMHFGVHEIAMVTWRPYSCEPSCFLNSVINDSGVMHRTGPITRPSGRSLVLDVQR